MLDRMTVGDVPRKHHIALRGPDGALRFEECITREGFDGPYTIVYHLRRPHTARQVEAQARFATPVSAGPRPLRRRHYDSNLLAPGGSMLTARTPILFNRDVAIHVSKPTEADPAYFNNADADDLHYIFEGAGTVRTLFGDLRYQKNDYVYIPRGTIHRFVPDAASTHHVLTFECLGGLGLPKQWRNAIGQLKMDAPFCHRDFTRPSFAGPVDEGLRHLVVKRGNQFDGFEYDESPLDLVGWDGAVYPWIFPILNFQPRVGQVHLPPTYHGTFATRGGLVCSFVPRVVDFHPESIPCPYPHSSVDVDEFIFYCDGNFTSRKGVGPGSMSYHPTGIPHGPHPGAYERSIGTKDTNELAVMLDVFEPLVPTAQAVAVEDAAYHESFRG